MAFDFPSTPTTGQTYSVSGGPTYIYDGTAWKVMAAGSGLVRTTFTATAGQTTFSVTYVVGYVDVYRNGIKLPTADYTATNGTSVVLANGCNAGDTIEIIASPMITYADAVRRTGDTITGNVTINGDLVASQIRAITDVSTGHAIRVLTPSGSGSPAIIQFTNNPAVAQWASITSSGQNALEVRDGGGTITLGVNTSRHVTTPYQPRFSGYGWPYQTKGAYSSTPLIITPTGANLNDGSHWNFSTHRFTVPTTGRYRIFFTGMTTVSNNLNVGAIINSSSVISNGYASGANAYNRIVLETIALLNANDYVQFGIFEGGLHEGWGNCNIELLG